MPSHLHVARNTIAAGTQTSSHVESNGMSIQSGKLHSSTLEGKAADGHGGDLLPPFRSPVVVPAGIVQQRTTLLASKLAAMGAGTNSRDRESSAIISSASPAAYATQMPRTPTKSPNSPLGLQRQTPRTNRVPSGGIVTPTRPLALKTTLTVLNSSPVGVNRPAPLPPPQQSSPGQQGKEMAPPQATEISEEKVAQLGDARPPLSPPPQISRPAQSPNLLRTPGKSGYLPFVCDTPSKANGNNFLGSPNRMRGLGLFVSPGKSATRSPKAPAQPPSVEPVLDYAALNVVLVSPKSQPDSRQRLTESGASKELDSAVPAMKGAHHSRSHDDRDKSTRKHHINSSGSDTSCPRLDANYSPDPRISDSSMGLSGRSSGDTGGSSAEVWEKVEWSEDGAAKKIGIPGRAGQKPKKRRE